MSVRLGKKGVIGRILLVILLCSWLGIASVSGDSLSDLEKKTAYTYINSIRKSAGLKPFRKNSILESSAQHHAEYLAANDVIGHLEKERQYRFTGVEPNDRAIAAGYESREVTENFSAGQQGARESIDGLMSAIYHRLGFLDLLKDEIGIGIIRDRRGFKFVYDMGSRSLNRLCRLVIYRDEIPFYEHVCKQGDKVSSVVYDKRKKALYRNNPLFVVWPFNGAQNVPVVFYEESPDPLPDYAVSGYPVSVQLNPFYYRQIKLLSFKLFRVKDNTEVSPVRLMSQKLDPNQRFQEHEFALFPLKRLDWDTKYRVEILFRANRKTSRQSWTFKTENPALPMFTIYARQEILKIKSGRKYLVYIPPNDRWPYIEQLHWETFSSVQTHVERKDKNTIILSVDGDTCEQVQFYLNGNRRFTARISEEEGLLDRPDSQKDMVSSCTLSVIKDLPGYHVSGTGETLTMIPGQEYWLEMSDMGRLISELKWQNADNTDVQLKYLDPNIIKMKLTGSAGQLTTFYLSDRKSFKVLLVGR